ncbi:hypothetical protein V6N13_138197 [Hibiscus sabdariffa]|uniref:Uncharacterized protein n=1 Tax=Hibiscus sabdariffa TaxID=183260 RepID=A0ABR2QCX6_9ROSI
MGKSTSDDVAEISHKPRCHLKSAKDHISIAYEQSRMEWTIDSAKRRMRNSLVIQVLIALACLIASDRSLKKETTISFINSCNWVHHASFQLQSKHKQEI